MYYVFKVGEPWWNFNYVFDEFKDAKVCANKLRDNLGHKYCVVRVEDIYVTKSLEEKIYEE